MKSRQEMIDEFRHAVQGVWLDLVLRRLDDDELSRRLRVAQTKTDTLAANFYDQLHPSEPKPSANGPQTQKVQVQK